MTAELRDAYRQMNTLTLRAASAKTARQAVPELPFAVESTVRQGRLVMKVQGRVDTLTATELLEAFQKASPQADAIELDVEGLSYIMRKSVEAPSRFKIFHVRPEIKRILEMTGFDTFLLQ